MYWEVVSPMDSGRVGIVSPRSWFALSNILPSVGWYAGATFRNFDGVYLGLWILLNVALVSFDRASSRGRNRNS